MDLSKNVLISDWILSPQNNKYSRQELYKKSKHTSYVLDFFPERRGVYKLMWKNVAEADISQMAL
jgi:hypothetical protein